MLAGGSSDARKTHFPPTEQLFVIGEKATLSCKLLTSSILTIFYWSRNDTVYTSIHESPFCNHSQSVVSQSTTVHCTHSNVILIFWFFVVSQ